MGQIFPSYPTTRKKSSKAGKDDSYTWLLRAAQMALSNDQRVVAQMTHDSLRKLHAGNKLDGVSTNRSNWKLMMGCEFAGTQGNRFKIHTDFNAEFSGGRWHMIPVLTEALRVHGRSFPVESTDIGETTTYHLEPQEEKWSYAEVLPIDGFPGGRMTIEIAPGVWKVKHLPHPVVMNPVLRAGDVAWTRKILEEFDRHWEPIGLAHRVKILSGGTSGRGRGRKRKVTP